MSRDEHYRKLERMYASAPINRFFEPDLSISEGEARIRVTVRDTLFHAAHAVHGSVYFKILDDSAFFAVNSIVDDVFVLTVGFNVYLLRPVTSGTMTATGRLIHRSRRLYVAESVIVDSQGQEVGRGSGSFVRGTTRLTPEIGYE